MAVNPVPIRAFHQREERYQGLQIEFDGSESVKSRILDTIDSVSQQRGISPSLNHFSDASIYIEFHDEYDRDGGEFFADLLGRLGIAQCESC
ncbi:MULTISPECIES: hypothetical protein [Sulfurimonas]|uniref:Uncharacterized protein n=1 Tax=Sulfurimonas diazotrophicus TaxID=3131939 RepID=A0ABZ3H6Q8_9BACT